MGGGGGVGGAVTCDDVLDGSIFALIDVPAVFHLLLLELLDQLLLLPLVLMRWRLQEGDTPKQHPRQRTVWSCVPTLCAFSMCSDGTIKQNQRF